MPSPTPPSTTNDEASPPGAAGGPQLRLGARRRPAATATGAGQEPLALTRSFGRDRALLLLGLRKLGKAIARAAAADVEGLGEPGWVVSAPQPASATGAAIAARTIKQCRRTSTQQSPKSDPQPSHLSACGYLCCDHDARLPAQNGSRCANVTIVSEPIAPNPVKVKITRKDSDLTELPANGRTVSM